jgi:arylsulfatase A-like enzyme
VAARADAFEPVYAAVLAAMDDTVGRLLRRLDELGLRDRTLVVFTSDNGGLHVPEGPHGRITHNTPFRAGKGYLYEGGLRIPLLVRWPGRVPAGRVVDAPVVNTDWLPTLLDLAGAAPPRDVDGVSLARLLTGGRAPARRFFWHFPHYTNQGSRPAGAVRDGDWKLIEHYEDGRLELFDLGRDPGEQMDRAGREPRRAARMRRWLETWRRAAGVQRNAPNPDCDLSQYRPIYVEFDASTFDPASADAVTWDLVAAWRRRMNAALPQPGRAGP